MIYLEKWRQGEKLFTFVWMYVLTVFSRGLGVGRSECDWSFSLKDHAQTPDGNWMKVYREKIYEKMAEVVWDWIFRNVGVVTEVINFVFSIFVWWKDK